MEYAFQNNTRQTQLMQYIPQILLIILGPGIFMYLLNGKKISKVLSPVVMSYALGIAVATFNLVPVSHDLSMNFSQACVLLAIPLLLFSADIIAWFKHAKSTVLSFFFAIIGALVSVLLLSFIFHKYIDGIWDYSAMLTGVYTGGTANLQAVGLGINASPDKVVGINTVEMLVGGLYLLFLTSVGPSFFGRFLPEYKDDQVDELKERELFSFSFWREMLVAFGIAILVAGASVGIVLLLDKLGLLSGGLSKNGSWLILALTTFSVLFSLMPRVRQLRGSFETGDYLIMMFCIAVGMMSDLGEILGNSKYLMLFTASSWLLSIAIHACLSYLAKIDRDTTIITSTAALYGPPFVGQIANVLGNRKIVFAGIATGLFGYAVGNYLGISIFYIVKNWLA